MANRWVDNDQVFKSNVLPTVVKTEQKIAEEAQDAIKTLNRMGAMDLVGILGLSPYLKED